MPNLRRSSPGAPSGQEAKGSPEMRGEKMGSAGFMAMLTWAARGIALGLIRAYQLLIAPILPPACRFTPTCSEYARLAITRYGLLRGVWLAAGRLARCHPFAEGGVDLP